MALIACIVLVGLIFTGDLLIKDHMERKNLAPGAEQPLWGGRILLRLHHNRGAAFHLGEQKSAMVAVLSVALTAVAAVYLLVCLGQGRNRLLLAGLTLLLGGAFSNTYDRLKRKYVVDYFSFGVRSKWLRNIIFNISDFCILIGALLAVLGTAR